MNELIERLAREAGMQHGEGIFHTDLADGDGVAEAAIYRFAALVAEQCALIVEDDSWQEGANAASDIRSKFLMPKP